jgi:hypothetical protein
VADTTATAVASASLNTIPSASADEPHERLPPRLQRALAQIVAAEAQKVEGHERGLRAAIRSLWLSLGSVGEGASASATS